MNLFWHFNRAKWFSRIASRLAIVRIKFTWGKQNFLGYLVPPYTSKTEGQAVPSALEEQEESYASKICIRTLQLLSTGVRRM